MKLKVTSLLFISVIAFAFIQKDESLAGIYKYDNSQGGKYAMTTTVTMTLNGDKTFSYKFADTKLGALLTIGKWEAKKEKLFLYSEKQMDYFKKDSVVATYRDTIAFFLSGAKICMEKNNKCFSKQ